MHRNEEIAKESSGKTVLRVPVLAGGAPDPGRSPGTPEIKHSWWRKARLSAMLSAPWKLQSCV